MPLSDIFLASSPRTASSFWYTLLNNTTHPSCLVHSTTTSFAKFRYIFFLKYVIASFRTPFPLSWNFSFCGCTSTWPRCYLQQSNQATVIPKEGLRKISRILAKAAAGGRRTTKEVWTQTQAGTRGSSELGADRGNNPNIPNESPPFWMPRAKSPSISLLLKEGFVWKGDPSSKGARERNTGPPKSVGGIMGVAEKSSSTDRHCAMGEKGDVEPNRSIVKEKENLIR